MKYYFLYLEILNTCLKDYNNFFKINVHFNESSCHKEAVDESQKTIYVFGLQVKISHNVRVIFFMDSISSFS